VLVKDINPGTASSYPRYLTNANGTLLFTASDGTSGYELWKSDGTAAGTTIVANLAAQSLTNVNGTLFFSADDGIHGQELWTLVDGPTLNVRGFPASITAGVAGSFTVTAKNADGSTNSGYRGTVHFTSSDPQAVLPADYTFTAADGGVHTFSATLKTAGMRSLTATDTANGALTGTQTSVLVNPAAASRLLVNALVFAAEVWANASFSLSVSVVDAYGNVVTGYRGKITFRSSDSTATLPKNYAFTAADAGVHTFTGLKLKKRGQQIITVTDALDSSLTGSVLINVV
jgi:ELWxxDGT repeat protein